MVTKPVSLSVAEVDHAEWCRYIGDCSGVNLLQSWQYGAAKERTGKWRAVRFVVRDAQGRPVALAQLLARDLPLLGGVARLNRGPLFVGDVDAAAREQMGVDVIGALLRECRRRRWWLVQFAPELHESQSAARALGELGLRRLPAAPWASGLVSLTPDDEQLLMTLQGKWRNCLRKGWRLGVTVESFHGDSSNLNELLAQYRRLQEDRGFTGLPDPLIVALAKQTGGDWQFSLFTATAADADGGSAPVGMLVSIRHGDTSTYLIGSTDDTGRKLHANYVLLWHAVLHAKRSGCRWFDIGGLNATTPQGIAHFKQGLNGNPYALVGEWRRFVVPIPGLR